MRCMTSSQTAERLLLVFGFIWRGIVVRMEGPSRLLPRPSEDLTSFANAGGDDEVDLLFDDSDVETSSVGDGCHESSLTPLDADAAFEDSRSECLPLEMEAALRAALASRTLTPLLKEELRCKIQLKRLQRGKEEMTPDFSVKSSVMSMEEVVKRNRKMEQNRMSAQRSRNKQKSLEKSIKSKLEVLEKENTSLAEQVKKLRHACQVARDWLQQHRACLEHTRVLASAGSLALPVLAPDSPASSSSSAASRLNSESSSVSSTSNINLVGSYMGCY